MPAYSPGDIVTWGSEREWCVVLGADRYNGYTVMSIARVDDTAPHEFRLDDEQVGDVRSFSISEIDNYNPRRFGGETTNHRADIERMRDWLGDRVDNDIFEADAVQELIDGYNIYAHVRMDPLVSEMDESFTVRVNLRGPSSRLSDAFVEFQNMVESLDLDLDDVEVESIDVRP